MADDLLITGVGVVLPPEVDSRLDLRLTAHQARRLDRLSQIAVVAALQAGDQAGLPRPADPGLRIGVVVGTGLGCLEKTDSYVDGIVRRGVEHADPLTFPDAIDNAPSAQVSIALGCRAPSLTVLQREISGECAVILAALMLRRGLADVVIAVAGETRSARQREALRRLSPATVPGEGAAAVVLEPADAARRRGAAPLGRLMGFAQVGEPGLPADWRTNLRRAAPPAVDRAVEEALRLSGFAAAARRAIALIPPCDASGPSGWIMGDGILRCAAALELLGRGGPPGAVVAAAARGGTAAALVLAPVDDRGPVRLPAPADAAR